MRTAAARMVPLSATAVAEAMRQLMDDPALREDLGGRARKRICSFFTVEAWLDNVQEALAGDAKGREAHRAP